MQPEPLDKDAWVDQVLTSLDGAARAEPSPFLYPQIRDRLVARRAATVAPGRAWLTFAALALLLLLNWRVVGVAAAPTEINRAATALVDAYDLGPADELMY